MAQARRHFFLPRRYRDPFGQDASVDFDADDLLMTETRDALGNRVTVNAHDYRVLQPRLISDPNRNQAAVAFDTLGMVAGTAVMGKPQPAPAEGDSLTGFAADLTPAQRDSIFDAADPHAAAPALLQQATTRLVYDLDRFQRTQQANPDDPTQWQPSCAATLARETHTSAPLPPQGLKIQLSISHSDGYGREIQKKIQAEPGSLTEGGAVVSLRWVGSGWTIFTTKGKPVRQYEPFFGPTQRFESAVTAGVSPVLFYDTPGRAIAILHPDHTYEKVVFGPWQQTTYDVNDTCAPRNAQTGDPRTDPDIGGYVAGYFKALPADPAKPWQTWHAQRIGGTLGPDQRIAAEQAAAHADTPTTAHLDALGRPFLTIARNRVVRAGHKLDGTEESFRSRVDLDIEGNQRAVRDAIEQGGDPLGRIVMRYAYDMLGNRIHQISMEAGARWILNDAVGNPICAWDSRGHSFTTAYDALRRPVKQTVRGTSADSDPRTLNRDILADKIEYGEPPASASQADLDRTLRLNLRTRIYRHFDSAGMTTNARLDATGNPVDAYDFKGNLLHSTRRLASDYTTIPDWRLNPPLDDETFEASNRYDALNRTIQSIAPHSSLARAKRNIIQPVFNEASLLERVDVWLERADEPAALLDPGNETPSPAGIAGIDYNAKGQRLRIDYKNGASTRYRYDPETFRLIHLYTRRGAAFTGDCDNPQPPPPTIAAPETPPLGKACGLQNLRYTYDPAGNITHIQDDAQQIIYFRNKRVEPGNDYTFDALYRLIQATGREHLGQANGVPDPPTAPDAFNAFHTRLDHPGDGNAMGTYIERYVYDAAGNFLQMQHRGSDPAHPGWTRAYDYTETSLIEDGSGGAALKTGNRLTRTTLNPNGAKPTLAESYLHDAHGNMIRMPHLGAGQPEPNMHWDYKDQLRWTDRGGGSITFYVYDASGQRVRKVWEKAPGLAEERIYLGGFEIFRRYIGKNLALERETLHIMDGTQCVALIEARTQGADPAPQQLLRYQYSNHLGSAVLELDEAAQVITYEEYFPYGSTAYQASRNQTETPKRYRYTSKERDEETGLSYHGARYYAPWLGQWVSCDPIGLVDGVNAYTYVNRNPLRLRDPSGAQGQPPDFEADTAKMLGAPSPAVKQVDLSTKTEAVRELDRRRKDPGDTLPGPAQLSAEGLKRQDSKPIPIDPGCRPIGGIEKPPATEEKMREWKPAVPKAEGTVTVTFQGAEVTMREAEYDVLTAPAMKEQARAIFNGLGGGLAGIGAAKNLNDMRSQEAAGSNRPTIVSTDNPGAPGAPGALPRDVQTFTSSFYESNRSLNTLSTNVVATVRDLGVRNPTLTVGVSAGVINGKVEYRVTVSDPNTWNVLKANEGRLPGGMRMGPPPTMAGGGNLDPMRHVEVEGPLGMLSEGAKGVVVGTSRLSCVENCEPQWNQSGSPENVWHTNRQGL